MVFNIINNNTNIYGGLNKNKVIEGKSINNFNGHLDYLGTNLLNYELGELMYSRNMEWFSSGNTKFLRTKRGSTLYKDITANSLGSGVFYDDGDSYFFWIDSSGNLKYLDSDKEIQILKTEMDTTYTHEFWYYGLSNNETLYGCNKTDGWYKITLSGSTFTYEVVDDLGYDSMSFSQISGRMILVKGHKAFYGDIQNQAAVDTSNLENIDTTSYDIPTRNKWTWVNADQGDGIQKVIDNGELTFYFKDTGVWALVNAEEEIENWFQPQCNVDTGTKSPHTVKYVKYGQLESFIYLGADNTLRLFNAQVTRNSGAVPTLTGGDSLIISKPFQRLLNDIPDGQLSKCKGFYFKNYYILGIVSGDSDSIDTTIVLDLDKLTTAKGSEDVAQPYWFYADNMEYLNYVVIDNQKLYGFHKNGYINQVFVEDNYYEEIPDRITPEQEFNDYIELSGAPIVYDQALTLGWQLIAVPYNESTLASKIATDMAAQGLTITSLAQGSPDGITTTYTVATGVTDFSVTYGEAIFVNKSGAPTGDVLSVDSAIDITQDYFFEEGWNMFGKLIGDLTLTTAEFTALINADSTVMTRIYWMESGSWKFYNCETSTGDTTTINGKINGYYLKFASDYIWSPRDASFRKNEVVEVLNAWVDRSNTSTWFNVANSETGQNQAAVDTSNIYLSTDYGETWSATTDVGTWTGIAISGTGKYITAASYGGKIYISSDYGATFTAKAVDKNWFCVGMSSDGKYQLAGISGDKVYVSSDYGVTWTARGTSSTCYAVDVSDNGKYMVSASQANSYIYVSSDYGVTWAATSIIGNWPSVSMSSTGKYVTAVKSSGYIYLSSDYGQTWTTTASVLAWIGVTISGDGELQYACVNGGYLYESTDYGKTWTAKDSVRYWNKIATSTDGLYQVACVTPLSSSGNLYTHKYSGEYGDTTIDITGTALLVNNVNGSWTDGATITGSKSGSTGVISAVTRRVAIEWKSIIAWNKFSSMQLRLYDAYINYAVEGNWPINFTVNSFIFGDSIPQIDDGSLFVIKPNNLSGSFFDYSTFGINTFSNESGQLSQNSGGEGFGNYFSFGFYGNKYNEWATIYGIEPRFEVVKNDTISKNY